MSIVSDMWPFEHLVYMTVLAAFAVIAFACGGFYLAVRKFPGHRLGGRIVIVVTIGISITFSTGLHQLWEARRERDQRVWTARGQHLQRLQQLLRSESRSLNEIAQGLREGRYFTLVADDARKAVWRDEALTTDVERHFPEYFHERERLIREVLQYDNELGRIRQIVSASLRLTEATERYRSDLVPALVNKCAGAAPGTSFVPIGDTSSSGRVGDRPPDAGSLEQFVPMHAAARTFEQYRCTVDLGRMCQAVLDRAADLADAASLASEEARRYAEETVLHGSCTYAPPN